MTYGCQATSFPRFSEICLKTGKISLLATGALCLDLLNVSISLLSLHLCWSGSFGMGRVQGSSSIDILSFSRVSGNYYCFGVLLTWKWAWTVTFNFSNSSEWTCLLLAPGTSLYAKAPGPTVGSTDCAEENLPAAAGDVGSVPGLRSSPGGGNGKPLQYSSRDNHPMDRGAWWATVPGYAKSWPQLSGWAHVQALCPTGNFINK